jgi:hypothetical protein
MGFTYTGENVQEHPTFKIPPVGDYTVQIIKGEEKISKSGKNMIALTVKIQHPEYRNEMFDYIVEGEYAQQRIHDILTSCGVVLQKGMAVTPQTFVNRTGKVRIKHEEYNGETQLRINYWKKADNPAPAPSRGVDPSFNPANNNNVNPDGIPF